VNERECVWLYMLCLSVWLSIWVFVSMCVSVRKYVRECVWEYARVWMGVWVCGCVRVCFIVSECVREYVRVWIYVYECVLKVAESVFNELSLTFDYSTLFQALKKINLNKKMMNW